MKIKFALIVLIISVFIISCGPPGVYEDGGITVEISGMDEANGHILYVTIIQDSTAIGSGNMTVSGGAAMVTPNILGFPDPWIGTGGDSYMILIGIDMNDDSTVGNSGDLRPSNYDGDTHIVDGPIIENLTSSDFNTVP